MAETSPPLWLLLAILRRSGNVVVAVHRRLRQRQLPPIESTRHDATRVFGQCRPQQITGFDKGLPASVKVKAVGFVPAIRPALTARAAEFRLKISGGRKVVPGAAQRDVVQPEFR